MKAVVYEGPCTVEVKSVNDPRIEDPRDAVVKLTSTAICGSDLHMYEGRTDMKPGRIMGHENMGVVEEIGPGVTSIKKGDRVVMPFNIGCGFCFNCLRGFTSACLTVNPQATHGAYGYADMGPFPGGQAEYLRVPYADFNALKLPGEPGDQWEDDFVLLADIWPTGYHATELARVQPGGSVAIFGAGPVGLMATLSAVLKGAAQVFVVDDVPGRLEKAKKLGGIPIDFSKGDPVEQIREMRQSMAPLRAAMRPGEERLLKGVDCGIDAVGYQAYSDQNPPKNDPMQVIEQLTELVNEAGTLGIIGVYEKADPGASTPDEKKGIFSMPWGKIWGKGLQIGTGQAPVKRYNEFLRNLIIAGKAKPSEIITQHLPLTEAAEGYKNFDKRGGDWIKVILKPGMESNTLVETVKNPVQ